MDWECAAYEERGVLCGVVASVNANTTILATNKVEQPYPRVYSLSVKKSGEVWTIKVPRATSPRVRVPTTAAMYPTTELAGRT